MKNTVYTFIFATFLFAFSLPLAAQSDYQSPTDYDAPANVIISSRSWIDVDYIGDKKVGHLLDIHLPTTPQDAYPVMVVIYGSAWSSNLGKATVFNSGLGQALLQSGFAVVAINHRSCQEDAFPAQIQDVKAAIRFIRESAGKFSLDTTFIGITGPSSGGHLSALAGTTSGVKKYSHNGYEINLEGHLGPFPNRSSHVDAVVDWFGPTDIAEITHCEGLADKSQTVVTLSNTLVHLIGGAVRDNMDVFRALNPLIYAQKGNPPFLIFHGDSDSMVPVCQSRLLYQKLQEAGVPSELVVVPGGQHGPGVFNAETFFKMIQFLQQARNNKVSK
jgi:acetyl esterase/lipase